MIIDSSNIQMSSQRTAVQRDVRQESLKVWIGPQRPDFEGESTHLSHGGRDSASISGEARHKLASMMHDGAKRAADEAKAVEKAATDEAMDAVDDDPKLLLIKLIVEKLTGRIDMHTAREILAGVEAKSHPQAKQQVQQNQPPPSQGYGVEYDSYQAHYESETTTFAAEGVIKTADGKEISFKTELSMSREYASEERVSIRAGDAVRLKDPLVINFSGTAAQLTDTKFAFDLDTDGTVDQVSFVSANSGFLALDANGDGKVNNGGELFGPTTGDGFSELAQYDQDNNNWIDENDAVYNSLLVWSKNGAGQDSLVGLKERGVGAIYLGNVDTQFDVKTGTNDLQGQVKATGIYVSESGSVGTVQQVDLAL